MMMTLQEGSRYNALHVAAKAMNPQLCDMILTTVGDPAFVNKLYGGDSDDECCKVSEHVGCKACSTCLQN